MQRTEMADLLERFVSGDVREWEFDDFIFSRCDDPVLEGYREEIARLPDLYPASQESHFTSQIGIDRILEISRALRTLGEGNR